VPNETGNLPPATEQKAPAAPSTAPAPRPATAGAQSSAKPAPRSKRKFGISLYHAWCKRCSICGEFCPTKAIVNDELGVPKVTDEDKCVGCMQCVFRCPDFCVEVYEKPANQEKADTALAKPGATGKAKN